MSDDFSLAIQEVTINKPRRPARPRRPRVDATHIEYLANGLGAQSMWLLRAAGLRIIPAMVSISADTGDEQDCLISTGERMTNREFFARYVVPLASEWDIDARIVRARDKDGADLPAIQDYTDLMIAQGRANHCKMPMFGSDGGRLNQPCTSRWKVRAIRQELRRMGATSARGAQGIHLGEAVRRMKGANPRQEGGFTTWDDVEGQRDGEPIVSGTWSHYYPLVEFRLDRAVVNADLERYGIPYIVGSMCDRCPHKGRRHWLRTSPDKIAEIAAQEAKFGGEFFFTSLRIPLLDAIETMRGTTDMTDMTDSEDALFDCDSGICGV